MKKLHFFLSNSSMKFGVLGFISFSTKVWPVDQQHIMQSRIREILSKLVFCQKLKKNKSPSNKDVLNSEPPIHEVDDKGYTKQPPSNPEVNNHDPWLDFQQSKNHFYSSSDDSDDEASKRKIKVSIKPVSNTDVKSASLYEPFGVLELSPPPSVHRTTTNFDGQLLNSLPRPRPSSRMSKTSVSTLSRPKGTPSPALG